MSKHHYQAVLPGPATSPGQTTSPGQAEVHDKITAQVQAHPPGSQTTAGSRTGESCPVIDRARCVYCRRCGEACPTGAPYRDGDAFTIDYSLCTACGTCLTVCRTDAISLYGPQNTASA